MCANVGTRRHVLDDRLTRGGPSTVWTRQQVNTEHPGVFVPGRDARALSGAGGDGVVLVKMAYWLGR